MSIIVFLAAITLACALELYLELHVFSVDFCQVGGYY